MKRLLTALGFLCVCFAARAQVDPAYPSPPPSPPTVETAEAFINTDPGFGGAAAISITPSTDATGSYTFSTGSLAAGIHRLMLRSRSTTGVWSISTMRDLVIDPLYSTPPALQNVVKAEWFFGADPGFGQGTAVTLAAATDIPAAVLSIPTAVLPPGLTRVYLRMQDADERWSQTYSADIVVELPYAVAPALTNIVRAEYFINTDPGVGLGTSLTVTPGTDIASLPVSVTTTSLPAGVHRLYIRTQDAGGRWSITARQDFAVNFDPAYAAAPPAPGAVVKAEYFVDTDPGMGSGTDVPLTPGLDIASLPVSVATSALATGIHRLHIRTLDAGGRWSIAAYREFLVDANPSYVSAAPATAVVRAEYFMDTDPGFGAGVAVPVTAATDIPSLAVPVSTSALTPGIHRLYVRTQDGLGRWSLSGRSEFLVSSDFVYSSPPPALSNIVASEYFFDTDPGFGAGTPIALSPGTDLAGLSFAASVTGLTGGIHRLYVRSLDAGGRWSLAARQEFLLSDDYAYPTAPPAPSNIATAEYFIDVDPGFGEATPIALSPAIDVANAQISVNTSGLSQGVHTLFIRSRRNPWSLTAAVPFSVSTPLAVALLDFGAEKVGHVARLSWEASAASLAGFEVQRSTDGSLWRMLGDMPASPLPTYTFTDATPPSGTVWYRLQLRSLDGGSAFSSARSLYFDATTKDWMVSPNPARGYMMVEGVQPGARIELYNAAGAQVAIFEADATAAFSIGHLPPGAYVVAVEGRGTKPIIIR